MSSTPIPGNEEPFWSLVELAMQKGVEVITYRDHLVHLSGHSTAAELQRIMRLLRPRWIVPFHGDYYRHAVMRELGRKVGIHDDGFVAASNGDRVEFDGRPRVRHMSWTVDSYQLGKGRQRSSMLLTDSVIQERKSLLESGAVVLRHGGRRAVVTCIDCPPDVVEWAAQASSGKRRPACDLARELDAAFPSPPVLIELG
jgi:ribonuclease J